MSTQTATAAKPAETAQAAPPAPRAEIAVFQRPRLPWHDQIEKSFGDIGVTKSTWKALIDAVFPAAKSIDSVILALSYCKARKLDPFKRPVHIVPVWDSDKRGYVDTVWPGISEIRTTAVRTGNYAGCDAAVFGPDATRTFVGEVGKDKTKREVTLTFPEWAQVTVYRMIEGKRVAITGPRVYWEETYATIGRSELPNAMWERRKRGQLEKCAEAAALRRAFPEELGSEYSAEEMEGSELYSSGTTIEATAKSPAPQSAAATLDTLVTEHSEAETTTTVETESVQATEDRGESVLAEQAAGDAETPLARGRRLLASCVAPAHVADLYKTIADEITAEDELQAWAEECNARTAAVTPAPNGKRK